MEAAGELPELLERGRKLLGRGLQELLRRGGVVVQPCLSQPEREGERHETLLRAVVEVPLEPAPCGITRLHDPCARRGQLLPRLGVREREGDQPRELSEPFLGVGREPIRRPDRDGGRAPELPRDDDRCSDVRGDVGRAHRLPGLTAAPLEVDAGGVPGVRDSFDRASLKRQPSLRRRRPNRSGAQPPTITDSSLPGA